MIPLKKKIKYFKLVTNYVDDNLSIEEYYYFKPYNRRNNEYYSTLEYENRYILTIKKISIRIPYFIFKILLNFNTKSNYRLKR